MQSVEENEYVFEIKNSKFISFVFHLTCTEDVERYLRMVKIKYPEATHYCYSYIFGEKRYSSDLLQWSASENHRSRGKADPGR